MSDIELLDKNWLKPIIYAIKSMSPCCIVRASDPLRIQQILTLRIKSRDGKSWFKEAYYIDLIYNKVMRVVWDNGSIRFEEIRGDNPYQQMNPIDFARSILFNNKKALVILHLPLVKQNPLVSPELITNFIYTIITNPNVAVNGNFLLVIAPELEHYFANKILETLIVIEEPFAIEDERKRLFKRWIEEINPLVGQTQIDINPLIEITSGLYPFQLRTIFKYALVSDPKNLTKSLLTERAKIFSKAYGITLENPAMNFSHVGGYEYAKQYMSKFLLRLKYRDLLRKSGVGLPKGLLLFGPAGTGKTYFAKAIAGELRFPLIQIDFGMFASKWYGETESKLKSLIRVIESIAPVVVLLDEVEQMGIVRRGDTHEVTMRVVSILNTWLADRNRKSFVVATCNYPELLDPAFIRFGRFDARLPFLYPNLDARKQILSIHLFKIRKLKAEVDLDLIAKKTHLYSGAELEAIVERSIDYALEDLDSNPRRKTIKITTDHMLRALKTVKIDYQKRKETLERYIRIARDFGTDELVLEAIEREYVKPLTMETTDLVVE